MIQDCPRGEFSRRRCAWRSIAGHLGSGFVTRSQAIWSVPETHLTCHSTRLATHRCS